MSESEPKKKKMISLRLSDVEYDILKSHYRIFGARNISDLARLAIHRIMNDSAVPPDAITARLAELEDRVHTLESRISLLLLDREHALSAVSR